MTDDKALRHKLDQLGATTIEATDNARVLSAVTPESALVAVLQEIDTTVLGRRLEFTNEADAGLSIDVAGRRILRVAGLKPETYASEFADLVGTALEDSDSVEVDLFLQALQVLAEDTAELFVTASPLPRGQGGGLGCSAATLADAWDLELYAEADTAPNSDNPIDRLMALCGPAATALVLFEDGLPAKQDGTKDAAMALANLAMDGISALHQTTEVEQPPCLLLTNPANPAEVLLWAGDDARSVLMVLPSDQRAQAIKAWAG